MAQFSVKIMRPPGSVLGENQQFLQVLFDHANAGGFNGAFTSSTNMDVLRQSLLETAQAVIGKSVRNVLIVDIVRQDSQ